MNRKISIPTAFDQFERIGRIENFVRAAEAIHGENLADKYAPGFPVDDKDIYKVIEGASYTLSIHPDPKLQAYVNSLIQKIGAAQEPDGYPALLYGVEVIEGEAMTYRLDANHNSSTPKRLSARFRITPGRIEVLGKWRCGSLLLIPPSCIPRPIRRSRPRAKVTSSGPTMAENGNRARAWWPTRSRPRPRLTPVRIMIGLRKRVGKSGSNMIFLLLRPSPVLRFTGLLGRATHR